jgi:hypothetical protein
MAEESVVAPAYVGLELGPGSSMPNLAPRRTSVPEVVVEPSSDTEAAMLEGFPDADMAV